MYDAQIRPDVEDDVRIDSDGDWLDRLPIGTVVSSAALRRWRRQEGQDVYHWLMVGCTSSFDYAQYLHWLNALPTLGAIVDPTDERYQRFVQEHSGTEAIG